MLAPREQPSSFLALLNIKLESPVSNDPFFRAIGHAHFLRSLYKYFL
jgi:hypothetical protein